MKYLRTIFIIFLVVTINGCVVIKESSFNQDKYLKANHENPIEIYSNTRQKDYFLPIMDFYSHGNVRGIISKLLLVEFSYHPDFYMIELQEVIDGDSIGMIAFMYGHNNDLVDIYYTNHLVLNKKEYESLLNKVTIQKSDFQSTLELTSSGLLASLSLRDKNGKTIELSIKESKKRRKPKGLLAPIGSGSKSPEKFPFIYLKGFTLIKQKGTEFSLKIDNKEYVIDKIPALVDFERVYNAKYSFDNIMIDWNRNTAGSINQKRIENNQTRVYHETWQYFVKQNADFIEIDSIATTVNDKKFVLHFSPSIPDLRNLKEEILLEGKFAVQVDDITSIVGGTYYVTTEKDRVLFNMQLEKGWQPMPGKLWLKDYKWTLELRRIDENYSIKTYWINHRN